jgi:hypothetical protein
VDAVSFVDVIIFVQRIDLTKQGDNGGTSTTEDRTVQKSFQDLWVNGVT